MIQQHTVTLTRYQALEQKFEELSKLYLDQLKSYPEWIQLVLAPQDAPTKGGIYYPKQIAAQWIPFLKQHPNWKDFIHIEKDKDEITGEDRHLLWRKKDWDEAAPQRAAKAAAHKQTTREIWETRYRVLRTVRQLRALGMGKAVAMETVRGLLTTARVVQGIGDMINMLTPNCPFNAPIDEEDFEEFRAQWRCKGSHLYMDVWDITGNEDIDEAENADAYRIRYARELGVNPNHLPD